MSCFRGWKNHPAVMERSFPMIFFFFFFFCCCLVLQTSMAELEGQINPLYELSSREEMVQFAGYGEEKLSNVLVTGSVLCEACLHGESQLRAWPIQGALVNVNCHTNHKTRSVSRAKGVTDEYGEFIIDLPSHLHAIPNLERSCSVKVVRIPKSSICRPAYVRKHKSLKLSSVGNGIRTYAAGDIKFLHLSSKPLRACTGNGNSKNNQSAW